MSARRPYHYRGVDWKDPQAVREYNREAQARWRAANVPRKGDRGARDIGTHVGAILAKAISGGAQ